MRYMTHNNNNKQWPKTSDGGKSVEKRRKKSIFLIESESLA